MAPIAISRLYGEPILRGIIISNSAARAWATGWATTHLGIAKTKGSLYFPWLKLQPVFNFSPVSKLLSNTSHNFSHNFACMRISEED